MELTLREASEKLKVSRITMMRMLSVKVFPNAYKLNDGKSPWRIPEEDIEAYIQMRKNKKLSAK